MKVYVAPKAAVLSMNVNENIAASAIVTTTGAYYYENIGEGKARLQATDFVFDLNAGFVDKTLSDWAYYHTKTYEEAWSWLETGCGVRR